MSSHRGITANPFGNTSTTYFDYENLEEEEKEGVNPYLKAALVITLVLIIILFTFSSFIISNKRSDAIENINAMNSQMETVSTVFDSEVILGKLREESQNRGGDKKTALEASANLGRQVAKNPGRIELGMTNLEAGKEVVNYYGLCDAMSMIPQDVEGVQSGSESCKNLTDSAYKMMNSIREYNTMAGSFLGVIAVGNTDLLPDVTKD